MVPLTNPSRIAILVGAGLAKDAGLPSSVELADRLKKSLIQESQNTARGTKVEHDRDRARLLLSAFYFLNGGIRFQSGVLDRDSGRGTRTSTTIGESLGAICVRMASENRGVRESPT